MGDRDWLEAENEEPRHRAELKRILAESHHNSKVRRKSFPKNLWPGKQGDSFGGRKRQKAAPIRKPLPPTTDGEGYTCVVFIGEDEVQEFHHQDKSECKRIMRAFIRTKLHKSIRTAEQSEEGNKLTVRFLDE